jgi:WD repeat-containing protein 19
MSVAFIDDKSEGYIYNPVNSNVVKIPNLPSTTLGIVWEAFEPEKVEYNLNSDILNILLS